MLATSDRSAWPDWRPLDVASAPAISDGTHAAPGIASVTSTAGAPCDTDGSGDGVGDCVVVGVGDTDTVDDGVDESDVLAVVNAHVLCPTAPPV